ncbi:MAG: FG-GAP-like repeat-containing protein [Sumerlaeia bacterium]
MNSKILSCALSSALLIPSCLMAQWPGFATRVLYSTANDPTDIVTADFDGDGILDIATADAALSNVSVRLGDGDGTFGGRANFATINLPVSIFAADLDGDDILDLVTANNSQDVLCILIGNGDGTFQSYYTVATGNLAADVQAGDFDGDLVMDLAIVNQTDNDISIRLGNGDGTFGAATDYATQTTPRRLFIAELSGDSDLDIAVSNEVGDSVSVFIGNGDGTFANAVNYSTGNRPWNVHAADLNGDGLRDLILPLVDPDTVSILLNNGGGVFGAPTTYSTGNGPQGVDAADFDGDGNLDVAVAVGSASSVSVLLGNGNGTLQAAQTFASGASGPQNLAVGDFDADGSIDLASANSGFADTFSIYINLAEPSLDYSPASLAFGGIELGTGPSTETMVLTNDGSALLITTATLTNDGGGVFALSEVPVSPLTAGSTTTLAVTFDPDGLTTYTGQVTLETNLASSPTITLAISGEGIDTMPPSTQITGPSSGTLTQPSPTFDVTWTGDDTPGGSGLATVELFYNFSAAKGAPLTSYGVFASSPIVFDTGTTGGDGTYELFLAGTDAAGNTEPVTASAEVIVTFNDTSGVGGWDQLE